MVWQQFQENIFGSNSCLLCQAAHSGDFPSRSGLPLGPGWLAGWQAGWQAGMASSKNVKSKRKKEAALSTN